MLAHKKKCSKCKKTKGKKCYTKATKKADGLHSVCKVCAAEYHKRWYKAHHESVRVRVRDQALVRNFGLSSAAYDAMLAGQGGVCAICNKADQTGKRLAVDHDHETGQVRGLLCGQCNMWLGQLEARGWAMVSRAINYVMKESP